MVETYRICMLLTRKRRFDGPGRREFGEKIAWSKEGYGKRKKECAEGEADDSFGLLPKHNLRPILPSKLWLDILKRYPVNYQSK